MSSQHDHPWLTSLLIELSLWLLAVGIFLLAYIKEFHAEVSVASPHLFVIFTIWAGLLGLRIWTWKLIPGKAIKQWMAATLAVIPWTLLVTWYLLVIIGLSSWGRVTTWPIIQTYARQSSPLMGALGLPTWLPSVAMIFIPLTMVWATKRWFVAIDWSKKLANSLSIFGAILIGALLCMVSLAQFLRVSELQPPHTQEPVNLSFLPNAGLQRQTHVLGSSPKLDSAEKEARNSYKPERLKKPINIIIIVGDALRADHMGMYGYGRPTTPNLDALSRNGNATVIPIMRSACAESTCGLLAIASSRAVKDMPSQPITLQHVLRQHGYRSEMIMGGDHTNFYGLRQAYGHVDHYEDGSTQSTRYMNDDALVLDQASLIKDHNPSEPVVMQFHLMSTHGLGTRHKDSEKFMPQTNYYLWPQNNRIAKNSKDKSKAVNYYDNGMAQFDQLTAQLLNILRIKGYLESALVVITGDHGEMLGEHRRFGHRHEVHETVLNVPLILLRYGYDGQSFTTTRLAAQIDIAPTILKEIGATAPSTWQGWALQTTQGDRLVHFQQATIAGVYDTHEKPTVKYWKNFKNDEEFLFDIESDPLEHNNIIQRADPARLAYWRSAVSSARLVGEGRLP